MLLKINLKASKKAVISVTQATGVAVQSSLGG